MVPKVYALSRNYIDFWDTLDYFIFIPKLCFGGLKLSQQIFYIYSVFQTDFVKFCNIF